MLHTVCYRVGDTRFLNMETSSELEPRGVLPCHILFLQADRRHSIILNNANVATKISLQIVNSKAQQVRVCEMRNIQIYF